MRSSRKEYDRRMHRVLEYIDRQLERTLPLSELAGVAHFSPYHFHRLFSAWMGETFGDYLRRRRVEVAAMRMAAQPGLPVLQAALSVGFGSAEAFSRAFKLHFGHSPTAWRRDQGQQRAANSNPGQAQRKRNQAGGGEAAKHGVSRRTAKETHMNVRLTDREPVKVAYLRHVGPYGKPVSQFWQQQVYAWMASNDLLGRPRYGISHDDPGITAPEKCRYDACVEVPPKFVLAGNALETTIPGGKYAALRFKGRAEKIGEAWSSLLRDWLPSSGLQLDARPAFEHYPADAGYDPKTGVFTCEICIPVAPL